MAGAVRPAGFEPAGAASRRHTAQHRLQRVHLPAPAVRAVLRQLSGAPGRPAVLGDRPVSDRLAGRHRTGHVHQRALEGIQLHDGGRRDHREQILGLRQHRPSCRICPDVDQPGRDDRPVQPVPRRLPAVPAAADDALPAGLRRDLPHHQQVHRRGLSADLDDAVSRRLSPAQRHRVCHRGTDWNGAADCQPAAQHSPERGLQRQHVRLLQRPPDP